MSEASSDINVLRTSVSQTLEHLQRIGVTHLPAPDARAVEALRAQWNRDASPNEASQPASAPATQTPAATRHQPAAEPSQNVAPVPAKPPLSKPLPASQVSPGKYTTVPLPRVDRESSLEQWARSVYDCSRCEELAETRRTTVFGEGNPEARVCFFGEAPGAEEDRQGRPFVGPAGQLLTKIIEACKLSREEVYILNTLKCRPPGNRNPMSEELDNCRVHFESQLEIIQPDYIVCLGLFAAQSLLDTKLSIGRMRGKFHSYLGSKVVVTYHPAYLLRNEKMKGACWQDMQMMMRDMGLL